MDQPLQQPARIGDIVAVQPGAIVSRIVLKQSKGTVTLFAFDAGQELSEHSVPYDVLLHVVEGQAQVSIAGDPHNLSALDAIILPGGKPHAVRAVTAFKMLLTMIRP